ncbi:hypothetical protein ACT7C5_19430 [Bacillus pacificus]
MPHVLETSIYQIYEDRGWDILSNKNKYGANVFPTLDDLYYKVDVVVDTLGYDQRLKSDITAALGKDTLITCWWQRCHVKYR